ncbi:MAG: hypothetical protein JWO88_72, partial [Frankiales bacterium]|nr:hypothetical protein [Frankiales bacterium]
MRAGSRLTNGYVVVAMLAAAVGGRLLDGAALLPGVHEAGAVRGGSTGWLVALLISAALGVAAATQWTRTQRLSATARVV